MLSDDRPDQTIEDGDPADARPACMALVPMVASARWSHLSNQQLSRADPTFVTHLIATAEHDPQTRSLRRATPADALTAYTASQYQSPGAGIWTRQII
jgi:hypothetical protein